MSSQAVVRQQETPCIFDSAPNCSPIHSATDAVWIAVIVLFGIAAFLFYRRSSDFLGEDVFYADCARSLMAHGFYGINGRPETSQPPGMSGLLALLFTVFGYSTALCLRTMAVLEILGFIGAYELIKRRLSKLVAAAICILLISSPIYFQITTQWVSPSTPFLFTTMFSTLALWEYQKSFSRTGALMWGATLTVAVVVSLMFASAAIALLGAFLAVIVISLFRNKRVIPMRTRKLWPVLLVGVAVQGLWMHRTPAPSEWPLPGYPAPYLQQLKVKDGNHPELGMATASDVLVRVKSNLLAQSDLLAKLVLRHGVNQTKVAVTVTPFLLIGLGWVYSIWQTRGGGILEWYFAGYEFIYLLWPWRVEWRFFLPIAPLACLYVCEGIRSALVLIRTRPRITGAVWSPFGLILGLSGCHWLYTHRTTHGFGLLPDELLIPAWLLSSTVAAWMAYTGRTPALLLPNSEFAKWLMRPLAPFKASPYRISQYALGALFLMLVTIEVSSEVSLAKENVGIPDSQLMTNTDINPMAAEIQAALWVRSHTPLNSVIMARHLPLVYHYAQRKMVWFAPISNPDVLMQGVERHNVNFVIVIRHKIQYYLPDDDYCFDKLLTKHADVFRLVFQQPDLRIFEVQRQPVTTSVNTGDKGTFPPRGVVE